MKIAIVTACPSGVANSIISAGLLQQACKTLGWEAIIECHSTVIAGHTLTEDEIRAADLIVLATNSTIDTQRFVGKKVYQSSISACTTDPVEYLNQAAAQASELTQAQVTQAKAAKPITAANNQVVAKRIVAITACPTGVAHTFMAAEALEAEAVRQGHQIKVETRG
ncbi:MAG: PTS fructose transporter subunit EIIBC, partial [Vibrio sp.]